MQSTKNQKKIKDNDNIFGTYLPYINEMKAKMVKHQVTSATADTFQINICNRLLNCFYPSLMIRCPVYDYKMHLSNMSVYPSTSMLGNIFKLVNKYKNCVVLSPSCTHFRRRKGDFFFFQFLFLSSCVICLLTLLLLLLVFPLCIGFFSLFAMLFFHCVCVCVCVLCTFGSTNWRYV